MQPSEQILFEMITDLSSGTVDIKSLWNHIWTHGKLTKPTGELKGCMQDKLETEHPEVACDILIQRLPDPLTLELEKCTLLQKKGRHGKAPLSDLILM